MNFEKSKFNPSNLKNTLIQRSYIKKYGTKEDFEANHPNGFDIPAGQYVRYVDDNQVVEVLSLSSYMYDQKYIVDTYNLDDFINPTNRVLHEIHTKEDEPISEIESVFQSAAAYSSDQPNQITRKFKINTFTQNKLPKTYLHQRTHLIDDEMQNLLQRTPLSIVDELSWSDKDDYTIMHNRTITYSIPEYSMVVTSHENYQTTSFNHLNGYDFDNIMRYCTTASNRIVCDLLKKDTDNVIYVDKRIVNECKLTKLNSKLTTLDPRYLEIDNEPMAISEFQPQITMTAFNPCFHEYD